MNIFNFDVGIGGKEFTKFSNKNIHAPGGEITIVAHYFRKVVSRGSNLF